MLTATNPSTGETIGRIPTLSDEQLDQVFDASQAAYQKWRRFTFAERAAVLKKVAQHIREQVESLAPRMTEEMGKPIKEARAEIQKSAWCAEHYADNAEAYLAEEDIASDARRSYVRHCPLGTVLGILPWNAPWWIAFRFSAPALMAGNTCVLKHDPHVPGCAADIAQAFVDAGAPEGILLNAPLENARVADAIRDPRVAAISFTGSSKSGGLVASIAAAEIKPAVLELGGSDPCVILADADLEAAVEAVAISRMINAGQSCVAPKRLIVETPVHDAFVAQLEARLKKFVVGDPARDTTDIGPIAREDLRANLHRQMRESINAGATCHLGAIVSDDPGFFYPVTLLSGVTPDMPAACEETFGPVAIVMRARDAEEAIALANDTPYGLDASIWTAPERSESFVDAFEAGQIVVNGLVKTDPRLPSGGIKKSGYGRELGPHGIREFTNAQQVWIGPKQG